ncbi:ATP-binding protein [Patescibacteria group bacterium]|nr:ATP-binding protein [Patescibacteria group bacterium]
MLPTDPTAYLTVLALLTLAASFVQIRKNETDLKKRRKEIDQKMYETLILREVGERIGYELNLEKILDTIVNSLDKLLPYSVAGYMLISSDQNKINLRFHLEESVNRKFLDDTRGHMLEALSKATGKTYGTDAVSETLTGTIVDEGIRESLSSLWLVPLSINTRGIGVLGIASKKQGLYRGPEMEVLNKILAQANRAVANLEKVLATEEEKLNSMVTSMADGVLMLDANIALVVINPAAAELLGLSKDKKLTILDVAASLSDKIDLRAKIEESVSGNKLVVFENLRVGDKISQLLISPVKDEGGRILGTVVLFHDITAQKQLERVREEFTAMMVHELRAPLTVVRGATDMFLRDPNIASQQQGQDLLKTMQSSAATMLTLVNDLLDAAKIEAGKFQILKTAGDISAVVADRVLFFTQMANPKSITLAQEEVEPGLNAEFDRDRISQVLNNFLSNAIKFTPIGGKITVSAYKINSANDIHWRFAEGKPADAAIKSSAIIISVSDTGMGIAPEALPELFSKFKQLQPSDASHNKGTGLGLVIAKGIVESHGGTIFVQSKVNEGTTFYIVLPQTAPVPAA